MLSGLTLTIKCDLDIDIHSQSLQVKTPTSGHLSPDRAGGLRGQKGEERVHLEEAGGKGTGDEAGMFCVPGLDSVTQYGHLHHIHHSL